MPARSPQIAASPFHGYSDAEIAAWCGVSRARVRAYKSGRARVPVPVLRLWRLYADFQVLGPLWHGWQVRGGSIVDPDGNVTTVGQLRAYFWIMQLTRRLTDVPAHRVLRAEFERLLVSATSSPPCPTPQARHGEADQRLDGAASKRMEPASRPASPGAVGVRRVAVPA